MSVSVVDKLPVKPVPVTAKLAVPRVVFVRGTRNVAVCPVMLLASNVPVAAAVPQLNVNVATTSITVTGVVQDAVVLGEVITIA